MNGMNCETLTLIPNDRRSAIINHWPQHTNNQGRRVRIRWGGGMLLQGVPRSVNSFENGRKFFKLILYYYLFYKFNRHTHMMAYWWRTILQVFRDQIHHRSQLRTSNDKQGSSCNTVKFQSIYVQYIYPN